MTTLREQKLPREILALAAFAICLGVFFRCWHLERKVFWDDEIYSAFRIYGLSEEEVNQSAAKATTAADLQAILHPHPPAAGAARTIATLVNEEPQHAPTFSCSSTGGSSWPEPRSPA